MSWEDTVLNDDKIHEAWCSFKGKNITDRKHKIMRVGDGERAIAKDQAKDTWPIAYKEGKEAGRKEVVEWLSSHYVGCSTSGVNTYLIPREEREAKLAEWRLKWTTG